jgi:DNA/RNA-binding domain of Phe-tRNA-synthetase-like protein
MLAVDRNIFDFFPGMRLVVCVAEGLSVTSAAADAHKVLEAACGLIASSPGFEPPQSHPRIAPWWRAFEKMGISPSKFPPAIAALVKAAKKGKLRSINPIVDYYNALSLTHVVPIGAWDLDGLDNGRFDLGFTKGGEEFRALGSTQVERVPEGEVAYFDSAEIVTRHFIWKQSEKGKITTTTKRLCILSEILPECGGNVVQEVADDLRNGLSRLFGAEPRRMVMPDEGYSIG